MKKNLRFIIALIFGKLAMWLQKLLGMNASYFPGKLAIKLCPDFLGRIDKPKTIITVTGTNGKTTCCNMILDVLSDAGFKVLNNRAGSNTDAGIATSLISGSTLGGKAKFEYAVFEVDERSSLRIYKYVHPDYAVCTNLFRDSIQRNAHPEFIFSFIDSALPDDTHMILNADDPISSRLKKDNKRSYFSLSRLPTDRDECVNIINDMRACPYCGGKLQYEYVRYHHIGKMKCPGCGFASPKADYLASPDYEKRCFTVRSDKGEEEYPLINDSVFNTYNQVTVVTLLRELGLSAENIAKSFSHMSIVKSRYTNVEKNGVEVVTNMTKGQNPVACSIVFDYIRSEPGVKEVIVMLDDLTYKKTTEIVTWVYDADFEFLNDESIKRIVVGGVRMHDYHLRLLLAGVPEEKIRCVEHETDAPAELELDGTDKVFILHDLTTPQLTSRCATAYLPVLRKRRHRHEDRGAVSRICKPFRRLLELEVSFALHAGGRAYRNRLQRRAALCFREGRYDNHGSNDRARSGACDKKAHAASRQTARAYRLRRCVSHDGERRRGVLRIYRERGRQPHCRLGPCSAARKARYDAQI